MTDQPYTNDDLRAAAALMHYGLTTEPNPADADAALSVNPRWLLVEPFSEYEEELREATVELVSKAANVSDWAVGLGIDKLEPEEHNVTLKAAERPIVRIHFAFAPEMPEDAREAFVMSLGQGAARALRMRELDV